MLKNGEQKAKKTQKRVLEIFSEIWYNGQKDIKLIDKQENKIKNFNIIHIHYNSKYKTVPK